MFTRYCILFSLQRVYTERNKEEKFECVSVHTGLPMSHHREAGKERDVRRPG